jgi:hypothetical protein
MLPVRVTLGFGRGRRWFGFAAVVHPAEARKFTHERTADRLPARRDVHDVRAADGHDHRWNRLVAADADVGSKPVGHPEVGPACHCDAVHLTSSAPYFTLENLALDNSGDPGVTVRLERRGDALQHNSINNGSTADGTGIGVDCVFASEGGSRSPSTRT